MVIVGILCAVIAFLVGIVLVVAGVVDICKGNYYMPEGVFIIATVYIAWACLFIVRALAY